MSFVVPFDGSRLARTALSRAGYLGAQCGIPVLAVTVLPEDTDYARKRDWLDPGEQFDADRIEDRLREQVHGIAPDATFQCHRVRRRLDYGAIARIVRDTAERAGADVVFLGSENVGRIAKPISSIGGNVAARVDYDIYLVQKASESGATA
ncbi:MAG: universal stress protein [Salinirussus sp.]